MNEEQKPVEVTEAQVAASSAEVSHAGDVAAVESQIAPIQNPSQNVQTSEWVMEEVKRLVSDMDYADANATKLMTDYLAAEELLDRLRVEVFPDLPGLREAAQRDPELMDHYNDLVANSVLMACHALAVVRVTNKPIFERLNKNGTNRNFGFFLISCITGDWKMQNDTYRELRLIALSIAYKRKGWFHYDAPDVWITGAEDVMVTERERHKSLGIKEILIAMLDNEFAYVYHAFMCELIDELRRYYRKKNREQSISEIPEDHFPSRNLEMETVEAERQRKGVLRLVRKLECSSGTEPGRRALLHQFRLCLENPASCLEAGAIGGHEIRAVAQELGVSQQQARNYRKKLASASKSEPKLRELMEETRKLKLLLSELPEDEHNEEK